MRKQSALAALLNAAPKRLGWLFFLPCLAGGAVSKYHGSFPIEYFTKSSPALSFVAANHEVLRLAL
jgi:hypothetical protein